MKILIVDDNADDRRLLRYNIEHHGHEAIEAEDGQDGLEKAALHKPDLIISDAMMPRMDGFQFVKNLKEDKNLMSTPVVFYSAAYTGSQEAELGLSMGAEAYIIKPREPEELWGEIKSIIERTSGGAKKAEVKEAKGGEEFLKSYSHIVSAKLEEKVKELEAEIAVRKQTETALRLSEERYRVVTESASDAIICINTKDAIYLWNKKAEEMFGYAAEEAMGKWMHQLIVPEKYREKAYDGLKGFYQTGTGELIGKVKEITALRKDGSEFPIELSVSAMQVNDDWHATGIVRDITERKKAEEYLTLTSKVLAALNLSGDLTDLIRDVLSMIQNSTGIEAVAIRLQEGEDYPYYMTSGFPPEFVEAERYLCARDLEGQVVRDSIGKPVLECMCGNIISGRTDPSLPFFTKGGSFWTNSTTKLLASTTEKERQARTRNRCNGEGYESVALVPLPFGSKNIGLLQLNDRREGMYTEETIEFFERLGITIGIALARKKAEEKIKEQLDFLQRFEKVAVGREFRIKELRDENESLKARIEELEKKLKG